MSGTAIASYQDLDVGGLAMDMAAACYKLTEAFPKHEQFGMTSQIRRASVSVPANIAEGYGRDTRAMYVQFLRISQGSIRELETLLLICERVQLATVSNIQPVMDLTTRVSKMLRSLIRSLEKSAPA